MREKIRDILNEQYGKFTTNLELEYEKKIVDKLNDENIENRKTWVTYNQVVLELKNNLKDSLRVKELQYRLTDTENPNTACLEVLSEVKKLTPELERLYEKIMNF